MPKVPDIDLDDYGLEDDERRLEQATADREANGASLDQASDGDVADVPWMHVESEGDFVDEREVMTAAPAEEAIDAFLEHFNEHDLDGILELVGEDCEAPGLDRADEDLSVALADLWERRPTCQLTRGMLEEESAGMLWEVGEDSRWWRLAVVRFTTDQEGTIDCVAFDDAPDGVDRCEAPPPEAALDEGATWQEWQDGAAD